MDCVRSREMDWRGERAAGLPDLHGDGLPGWMMGDQVWPAVAVDIGQSQRLCSRPGQDIRARVEAAVSVTPQHDDLQAIGKVVADLRDQIDIAVSVEVGGTPDEINP